MIDFGIWTKVEEVSGDGVKTWWDWVVHGGITSTKNRSVDYLLIHTGLR